MKTFIIALLFRVSISKKSLDDKIDYILFVVEGLLVNPDFSDAVSLGFINALKTAALAARAASIKAESKATADIKDRNTAVAKMNKSYKQTVIHAEEVCGDDEEMAIRTGLEMRKKRSKKNASQPQNLRAESGKQEGEIDAKCKALGQGFSYVWQIRKVSMPAVVKELTTNKASVTFSGLDSGEKYELHVFGKTSNGLSEPSGKEEARAK